MTSRLRFGIRQLAVIGIVGVLASCATTRPVVTSVWTEPGKPAIYRHLVVIGVATTEKVERAYADQFIQSLQPQGVTADTSPALESALQRGRRTAIDKALAKTGADGVIITHLVAESGKTASTGQPHTAASQVLASDYAQIDHDVMQPDYYVHCQQLRLETSLYDARRKRLVWSGRSSPLAPDSEQTIGEIIAAVIAQLKQNGYLPSR